MVISFSKILRSPSALKKYSSLFVSLIFLMSVYRLQEDIMKGSESRVEFNGSVRFYVPNSATICHIARKYDIG